MHERMCSSAFTSMSEALGNMSYTDASYDGSSFGAPGSSEQEKALINSEARRLVDEAYERARDVLAGSRATLDRIASALLERETITAEELEALVTGTPLASSEGR